MTIRKEVFLKQNVYNAPLVNLITSQFLRKKGQERYIAQTLFNTESDPILIAAIISCIKTLLPYKAVSYIYEFKLL